MRDALINMVMLMGLDLALIVVVSFSAIMIMESKTLKNISAKWSEKVNDVWTYICRLKNVVVQDIRYNWKGLAVLFIAVIAILSIAWKWDFIGCSYFVNILCTFIAIVVIFIILRPRLYIDNQLYPLHITKSDKRLKVRVKNLGIFPVNNVEVQVLLYKYLDHPQNEDKRTKKLALLRPDSPILRGLFAKNEDMVFGCGTEWSIQEIKKKWEEKKYEGIICRVKATHVISGVTYVRERRFDAVTVEKFFSDNRIFNVHKSHSIEEACDQIISDIEEVNEQMKDIKKNVEIIQIENK